MIFLLIGIFLPFCAFAEDTTGNSSTEYVPLADFKLQGAEYTGGGFVAYLNVLYKVGVATAIFLALIMIILGGAQYMSTDSFTGKEEGKSKVTYALLGLLLALTSYMVLYTINPKLVTFSLDIQQVNTNSGGSTSN